MGQTITVTARQGSRPEVWFFDTNRSLTGMEIERYASPEDVHWQRPPDVLAKRLFDLGAQAVTIYSNVVTVEAPKEAWPQLEGNGPARDRAPLPLLRRRRGLVAGRAR